MSKYCNQRGRIQMSCRFKILLVVTTFFFCLEDGGSRLFKNSALEEHSCVIIDKS